MLYFLHRVYFRKSVVSFALRKNTANICNKFGGAQKIPKIFAVFFWSVKITAKNIAKKWLGKYGYRKYLQYFLRSAKITANICAIFCKAQKVPLKILQNKPKKNYSYRKYLRYFLRSAKITANICGIFCKTQKIPLKISQNKPKKTYGSYMSVLDKTAAVQS